jgi:glycosyltransferase involved in cell wall biosynthesis
MLAVAGPAEAFGSSRQSPLTEQIHAVGGVYLGAIAESRLAAVYNACDLFVMPTREVEMFGMAAAEAQASGRVVLASRHGALPEVLGEEGAIFFVNGDSESLAAQALAHLELPQSRRQQMQEAALANVIRFSWTAIVDQLAVIYDECLSRRRTRAAKP